MASSSSVEPSFDFNFVLPVTDAFVFKASEFFNLATEFWIEAIEELTVRLLPAYTSALLLIEAFKFLIYFCSECYFSLSDSAAVQVLF